jgi:DNA-directed RNA polymerase specialized sigma24 family protein
MTELSQSAFDRLLATLDEDRESAGERYEELRQRLVFFFEKRGCRTAPECADETLNRVAKKIAGGEEIRNLTSYCLGVAHNVLHEYWDGPHRAWADLDEVTPLQAGVANPLAEDRKREEEEQTRRQAGCMRECLARLPATERELITQYSTSGDRPRLAAQLAITLNALRIRINRIRDKLRQCVIDCLKKTSAGMK